MSKDKLYVSSEQLAEVMAETLNGGVFKSNLWYNGDRRDLWVKRAELVLSKLGD